MLVGYTPFKGNSKEKTVKNIKTGVFNFPMGLSHIPKDLIVKMLEKDKNKRIDIFAVKNHRWLTIMQPIRETMIQNLEPKVLAFIENEKTDEAKTAYSDNDTDEDIKHNPENAFNKSLKTLKQNLTFSTTEIMSNRSSLKDNCAEYYNLCQKEKDLKVKISEKNKELVRIIGNNKELLSKCFDLNLDLEKLQTRDFALDEGNKEMQKRLGDLKKKQKLQKIYLENLSAQVKSSSKLQTENEKTLASLQKQLQDIKTSASYTKQRQKSGLFELNLNLDVIKTKIEEKDKIISEFSSFDKTMAKEISDFIRGNMNSLKDYNREFARKLEESEDMIDYKEQQLSELVIEYEMKKCQSLHNFRKKKDEFSKTVRNEREESRIRHLKDIEEQRFKLKISLNESRKNEFYVEPNQIDQLKFRLKVRNK